MTAKSKRRLSCAAAVLTAAALMLYPPARAAACRTLGQAAVIASGLSMPDGAFALLRERYLRPDSAAPDGAAPDAAPPQEAQSSPPQSQHPTDIGAQDSAQEAAMPPGLPLYDIPQPDIPEEYCGTVSARTMSGENTGAFCPLEHAYIRNYTDLSPAEVRDIAAETPALAAYDGSGPQVLLFHTHATESYEPYDSGIYDTRSTWRSEDDSVNVVAVGNALSLALEAQGISVLHDTVQHDNPTYSGAYERSGETVAGYLEEYPTLRVLLDIHRDAINVSETEIAKVVANVDGRKAAQLMIIAPCDADGALGIPEWRENLRFAAGLTDAIEAEYPGLTRPVFFCARSYTYALSPGALLLEFGSSGNTLEEALYTAELIAPILAQYLSSLP